MSRVTWLAKSRAGVEPQESSLGREVMLARRRKGHGCDAGHLGLKVLQGVYTETNSRQGAGGVQSSEKGRCGGLLYVHATAAGYKLPECPHYAAVGLPPERAA